MHFILEVAKVGPLSVSVSGAEGLIIYAHLFQNLLPSVMATASCKKAPSQHMLVARVSLQPMLGRSCRHLCSGSNSVGGTLQSEQKDRIASGPGLEDFVPNAQRPPARLRLPGWLKRDIPSGGQFAKMQRGLRELKLHTVCEEARCPNIGECWSGESPTATIMLLGDTCTRACRFCSVKTGLKPPPPDPEEPANTARAVAEWTGHYLVLTSVDRDDLPDGGAGHFGRTVTEIHRLRPDMLVECLVPDFRGRQDCMETVVASGPQVLAHNLETVESLQRLVRDPKANYRQSLTALSHAKRCRPDIVTKSSLMLGLGETDEEILRAMADLRGVGVEALTLGQYVQPTKRHLKVRSYVAPEAFKRWEERGKEMGFLYTAAGPLVRSSYKAGEYYLSAVVTQRQGTPTSSAAE